MINVTRLLAGISVCVCLTASLVDSARTQGSPQAQAAAGSALPIVKDSNGKLVGVYSFSGLYINNFRETVVIKAPSGRYFGLDIAANQLFGPGYLDFPTADCSGQAYAQGMLEDGVNPPLVPLAVVIGTTAYIPSEKVVASLVIQSQLGSQGCVSNSFSSAEVPIASTFDLSVFVPPFSVQ